jgi:lipopolysaccharide export system protein LptA
MPLPIYRLRRWLMAIAVLFIAVIAGMYFYARLRERNVFKEVPNKIGIDIKQTASGFQFSKSDGGRTLFTIQASNLKQFKLNGSAELRNVSIVVYGRDSARFDQIYGDDFMYDKDSGNVVARGDVQIDLQANPSGENEPDQSAPKELKNPIHLKTRDLVFNQQSGDAHTDARVDFETAQATGWAVGVEYSAKANTLTLGSQIHITLIGKNEILLASHGEITRNPRVVVLDHARLERAGGIAQADQATFFLGADNNVERVHATGNVTAESTEAKSEQVRARADEGEMLLTGTHNMLRTATLTGNVHIERFGAQPMQGDAGRVVLDFSNRNELQRIHAFDGVRLAQHSAAVGAGANANSSPQDVEVAASIIDFFVADRSHIDRAVTSGAAQITISPANSTTSNSTAGERTVVTAGHFDAKFAAVPSGNGDGKIFSRLTSIHGEPDAKIVNSAPGAPDRVSTSDTVDAAFLPQGGIGSIVQQGGVVYTDNQPPEKRTQAWAQKATYTPSDNILVLNGNPRIADGGMATTATVMRINRATNVAYADGDVKSTYSELKEQPNGALLASSSPIHVTAASMTTQGSAAIALYKGKVRLWQDANVITAPSIQFDRNQRSLVAEGNAAQSVSTILVQAEHNSAEGTPSKSEDKTKNQPRSVAEEIVTITSLRLTYIDAERRAHYEGGVTARGSDFTATAERSDAYLLPRSKSIGTEELAGPGRLDRMISEGNVIVRQPGRRAEGQKLVYTALDDKFVLTGGPPSIFDAERGKITGVSLTFFRSDDRVLVEGVASTPVVTQTRMAH